MVSLCVCREASAQATVTWVGSDSSNFYESVPGTQSANWSLGQPLYDGSDVVGFTAGVTVNGTLDMNSAAPNLNLRGIDVEGASGNGESATIVDFAFGLGSYGIVVNGYSGSPSSLVITAPITLTAAQTWSVTNGTLEVDGPISHNTAAPLTLSGSTGSTFILTSGSSSITDGVTVTGAGTVLSLGASTSGVPGDLDSGPVGTGTLSMGAGTILGTPNSAGQIEVGNALAVASGVLLSPGACSSFLISGSISDLSGPGSIEVTGGTVVLTGSNSYSGGTTIDAGATLQLGNGGTSGSITGNVVDNNTLAFDLSNCTTFCGAITGSGGITVEDGMVTLMGTSNTYSGYTLVTSAALKDGAQGAFSPNSAVWLQNGASLGVGYNETINGLLGDCGTTVCISSGSTLLTDGYNGSCTYTYSGTIMGSGALEVGEGAFQILTGANTYSGGTTIDAGATLQLGNGGSTGSIAAGVVDNGTLAYDLSNCTTVCGPISGTGGVTVEDGMVTLMGTNTYSGTTLVTDAKLNDGAANSFSPNSAMSLTDGARLGVGFNETINGLSGDCSTTVCIASGSTLLTDGSNGSCNYTYAGTIMGSGALEIGSGGYQVLTGSSSYSGGTTIDCMATLQLGNGGSSGSIFGDVVDNGTLAFDLSSCSTFCGAISGTGGLLVESGAVTLIGVNSYSGGTTIDCMATLQLGNGGTTGSILAGVVDNGTLAFDLSNCTTFCGPISGAGGVTVEDGMVTLMGTNTYAGTTLVTNARLNDGAANSFSPNSAMNLTNGATLGVGFNETINGLSGDDTTTVCISSGSTLLTDGYNGICLYTYNGNIMGGGALEVGPGGFQILTGSNTYSGGTTIDCMATLQLGSGGTGGSIVGGVLDNGSFVFDLADCSSFSAGITGVGGVLVENGTVILSGTNTYSGTTSINGATLKDGAAGSFSTASSMFLTNGAALGVGFNETVAGLSGDCSTTVCITCGSTLTVGASSSDYAGTIMGGGALEIGEGTYQILTGANTYTGGTTIDGGGTLQVGGGDASGSITGNVVDNGNLAFSNSGCTTFSGSICGTGEVYVEAGTVIFTGTNTYGGATYVTSASLKDGAADAFSPNSAMTLTSEASVGVNYNEVINGLFGDCSNTVCIASGSTLLTDGYNNAQGFSGAIMGSGGLEVGRNAYQILSGTNTYTGGTTIDCMATLQLGNNTTTGSITGDVTDNGTLGFFQSSGSSTSFCGAISGSGGVIVGSGLVTLMGDNTYTGGTQMYEGTTLYVTNANAIGTGALTASSTFCLPTTLAASGSCVTLANNIVVGGSGLTLNFSGAPKLTLTGTISDLGSLDSLAINGPVDLEGNNTYSGGTTITNACVTIGTSTGLGTGAVTASGSTLTFTSGSSPVLSGATFESDSVVNFNGALSSLADLTLCGSTLNFNGASATLTDMVSDNSGSDNTINISGATQLTFDVSSGHETDYHGTITDDDTGTGSLVVNGPGVLDLKSANSYGGGTTVNGGLLVASNSNSLGNGPVTVNGPAAVGLSSSCVTIGNQITLNGGSLGGFGTFNPGNADTITLQGGSMVIGGTGALSTVGGGGTPVIGTLSFGNNANLVLAGGGVLEFSIMNALGAGGTDYSAINVGGNVSVTATSGNPFTIQLVGVDSTNQVIGTANTFNPSMPYTWTLLSVTGTTTGFNANAFVVDSSTYFSNPTSGGTFSVSDTGGDLTLNFTPVPEPSTWTLMACGLFAAAAVAARRRRRA